MRTGFVGWRGMVGSVLMQRMREEGDFTRIDPVFFSTSRAGSAAPAIGKTGGVPPGPVRDANDPAAFTGLDAIVTCQGGDWTKAMYPRLRTAGYTGYWIDAAQALLVQFLLAEDLDAHWHIRELLLAALCGDHDFLKAPARGRFARRFGGDNCGENQ